ncbi:MAG: hypothetical protein EOP56_17110 [Sphingobacteriales bacterium]|nr:MAG: hypothetical protein EOP56_17110 [Sphingobacteriales bacterium]
MQNMARTLRYLFVLLFVGIAGQVFAQGGAIVGKVTDKNNDAVIGAVVQAIQGGITKAGITTDEEGNYEIKPLDPGRYDVKITYVGFKEQTTTGVIISPDKTTRVNATLSPSTDLVEVEKIAYRVPLIDPYSPGTSTVRTAEEIEKMPTRSTEGVAATTAGVLSTGEGLSIAGARTEGTLYIIDGVQVRGGANTLTQGTVDQIQVLTSGLPARYGDALGGVINVTSKGPSPKLRGGVTLEHSVDGYNHNLASINLSGPIYSRKDSNGQKDTRIGFMLGAEVWYDEDRRPSYGGNYALKEDVLRRLEQNPIVGVTTPTGAVQYRYATEFVRAEDFEVRKKRQNAEVAEIRLNSRVDFKLTDQLNISAGGRLNYLDYTEWTRSWSYFTPDAQPVRKTINPMGYVRLTQRFNKGNAPTDGKKPLISNAYYTLQFDYQKDYTTREDPNHKRNLFKYGYVGKFYTDYMPIYQFGQDTLSKKTGIVMFAERIPTRTTFERSEINPVLANYTSSLQNFLGGFNGVYTTDIPALAGTSALVNGQLPSTSYNLFNNVGSALGGYSYANNDQFAVTVDASFDLQPAKGPKHAIGFGLYYQQRIERSFGATGARATGNPNIWQYMRQLTNRHIALDNSNPVFIVGGTRYSYNDVRNGVIAPSPYDTIVYSRIARDTAQSVFDANLRSKLGLAKNSTDYINVDEYDPEMFTLDMFSADELLNSGSGFVGYQGYTYTGARQKGQVNFNDFFTDRANRPIGSYRPNYIAGYIMDNFQFKDLMFNVGVRVDRFDANTKMLKDPYSLYGVNTIGEARSRGDVTLVNSTYATTLGKAASEGSNLHPGNIGDDYVVYVNSNTAQNRTVVGYRQGDDWYDPNGKFIEDPRTLSTLYNNGRDIQPLLVNTVQMNDANYDPNTSFTDYKPQVNVMPRVSFSFPISDVALFYAHYDVVVQRPDVAMFASPADYYYFSTLGTNLINNPGLKPQRLFDYEVGFQQQLSQRSALTLTAFYKERKDMIQVRPYLYAYPRTYYTYGNRDFSTTKGMTLKYDMRRTGNLRLDVAYTLQFAEGTGSSATSGNGGGGDRNYNGSGLLSNFIGASLPNMRYVTFLDYDARHNIVSTVDYRYGQSEGPVVGKSHILENAGVNFIFRTVSGQPYTRYAQPNQRFVVGGANQSRLPWTYNLDMRIDKDFNLSKMLRKDKEGEAKRADFVVNAFVLINNLLNTRNINNVNGYTSSPDDNGFLSHPIGVQETRTQVDPQSYIDLYTINQMNPNNLSLPRRINVGLNFSF